MGHGAEADAGSKRHMTSSASAWASSVASSSETNIVTSSSSRVHAAWPSAFLLSLVLFSYRLQLDRIEELFALGTVVLTTVSRYKLENV
jgi:hypothetical protein